MIVDGKKVQASEIAWVLVYGGESLRNKIYFVDGDYKQFAAGEFVVSETDEETSNLPILTSSVLALGWGSYRYCVLPSG